MAKRNNNSFQELSPSDKRALQLMTPEGRTELFGNKKAEEPKPVDAEPLVPDSPLKTFGQELAEGMYASNIAQQEPTVQRTAMRDAERELNYGPSGRPESLGQTIPIVEQFMRDNPLRGVGDPQGASAWTTTPSSSSPRGYELLNESGRAEFTAAANGEIPGYAIKDPGARAMFAQERMNNPNFGRQPSSEFNDGVSGNAAEGFLREDGSIDSEAFMREGSRQAQRDQQPRSSGGMGQGPLTTPMDDGTERRLEERIRLLNEAIRNAGDGPVEWNGRTYSKDEIRQMISRINGALGLKRRTGRNVVSDPASRRSVGAGFYNDYRGPSVRQGQYKAQRPYGGVSRGGGPNLGYGGFVPGETPSYGYDLGAAPSEAQPSGPIPPTMQNAISDDGSTFTTSDGFSFPNVIGEGGMSQDAFASAMAENTAADDDLLGYAESNGLITPSVRDRLNALDTRKMPSSLTSRQQADYQEQLRRERGALLYEIAQDATRHEERVRASAAKEAIAEERRGETEARSARVERDRLRRIYWAHVNPQTSGFLSIMNDALNVQPGKEADWAKLLQQMEEDPTKRHLTEEEYMEARQWDEQETARFEAAQRGKSGASAPQPPIQAPAPTSDQPTEKPWEFEPNPAGGYPFRATFSQTGETFPIFYIDYGDGKHRVLIRVRNRQEAENLVQQKPQIAATVDGFVVPNVAVGGKEAEQNWDKPMNPGLMIEIQRSPSGVSLEGQSTSSANNREDLIADF